MWDLIGSKMFELVSPRPDLDDLHHFEVVIYLGNKGILMNESTTNFSGLRLKAWATAYLALDSFPSQIVLQVSTCVPGSDYRASIFSNIAIDKNQ